LRAALAFAADYMQHEAVLAAEMRFLADENVSRLVIERLRASGFEPGRVRIRPLPR
jgi:hypothetical protein